MFEIDKKKFGEFLVQQRKAKGYTQKELADKLYVSDKAVSKWERALSMPDISLLIPLAEILDVSVTELLEGRKLDAVSEMDASQVESLVQKALSLSGDSPGRKRDGMRKQAAIFGGCTLLALLEILTGLWLLYRPGNTLFPSYLLVFEGLSFGFGIYFWFLIPQRLPVYYDENKISSFGNGFFRMNFPGLHFNNSNWRPVVKVLRIWSVTAMLAMPLPCFVSVWASGFRQAFVIQNVLLVCFLSGLFVPVYIIGKRYEGGEEKKPGKGKRWLSVFPALLVIVIFFAVMGFSGIFPSGSAVRVGYVSNDGMREWTARYNRLDGIMNKKIYPDSDAAAYVIEVTTESGTLSVELRDSSGSVIFAGEELQSGSYPVTLTGTTEVRIRAVNHRGRFAIRSY